MQRSPDALAGERFDLLILGGGITGAGVALDAALRGLRVALIDKGDFASGTSSVSSKLVHGGLRYLERGDLKLVWEALRERRILLRNAPHLVRPLRFIIPFHEGARMRPWKWRAGLTLYDLLAGSGNLKRSRPIPLRELARMVPSLHQHQLRGGAEYCDAQMDDARLCIEVLCTAAAVGANVVNYVEATAFEREGGQIVAVRAVDHRNGRELRISAKLILNATGPWVDAVCRLAGDAGPPHLRATKGSHLIVPDQGLAAAFLLLHPRDGRVFFVIPWMNKTLIGTTDTNCDESPEALTVTADEIDYLLEGHNHYFVNRLGPDAVIGKFAGLRPLLQARPGEPSARSREYRLFSSPSGLLSIAGGKYTTYRRMAEVVTDAILHRLGRKGQCRTRDHRLAGAPTSPWKTFQESEARFLEQYYPLTPAAAAHLVSRYGGRARNVAALIGPNSQLASTLVDGEPDLSVELGYQREHEMAMFPADCLLRRTRLGLFHPGLLAPPPAWD